MNIAAVFIVYFGIKETQFHRTLVREEDNRQNFEMRSLSLKLTSRNLKSCVP